MGLWTERVHMSLPEREVGQFRAVIRNLRAIHKGCTTATGRPGRGPRFYAVTECEDCGSAGMTSSKQPRKKRWTCRTCGGVKLPVWADGPTPDEEEIYDQWATGIPKSATDSPIIKLSKKGHANFTRRLGCSIRRDGTHCSWCEGEPT